MQDWKNLRRKLIGDPERNSIPPKVPVPSFPKALNEFSTKSTDPDANAKELGAIIETDAGLTLELVRYANSSAVGLRHPVSTAQQVVSILGARRCRMYLIQTVLGSIAKSCKSPLINAEGFSRGNMERAIFAQSIAETMKLDKEVAYSAGLVQDFLLPLLFEQNHDLYADWFDNHSKTISLANFEQENMGFNHAEASAMLMLQWNFPDEVICCVAMHHKLEDIISDRECWSSELSAAAMAGLLPTSLMTEPSGVRMLRVIEEQWPELQLNFRAAQVDSAIHEFFGDYEGESVATRVGADVATDAHAEVAAT